MSYDLMVFESIVFCSEFGYILNLYALFNAPHLIILTTNLHYIVSSFF